MHSLKRLTAALLASALLAGPTALAADTAAQPDPMGEYAATYGHMFGLTPAQRLEDYEYFWKTLRESDPYYGLLVREGHDMDALYTEYKQMVTSYDNDVDLYSALYSLCFRFGGTGHLSFIDSQMRDYMIPLYQDMEGRSTWVKALQNEVSNKQYPKLAKLEAQIARAADGADTPRTAKQDNVTALHLNDQTAYLKVSSFAYENIAQDKRKITDFYATLKDCKNLIIDVTGNGGGSDTYWQELLVAPLINKTLTSTNYILFQNTAHNQPYLNEAMNAQQFQPIDKLPKLDALQDRDRMTHFIQEAVTIAPADKRAPFSGKVWLLVDDAVYSSSEAFAVFAKQTGFATLVGTQTGGDGIGMDPVFMVLPNSGLIFRYSALYGLNADGSCNEEFGTTPDLVSQGEAPLTTALRAILRS